MSDRLFVIALALFSLALLLLTQAYESDDWRDEWCDPSCWADDGQREPCEDCPWRRRERR
jgi:hypothetical protein